MNISPLIMFIYGGLNLVEKVFGIKFIENKDFIKNKDIKYFDIYVQDNLVFQAVFDLYERTEKQMSGFVSDIKPNLSHEAGIMYVSCSFSEKVYFS